MVFGIKGPKELLAAAIAAALAEYFEVDPTKIESNLMADAKIILRNVKLRSQVSDIQPGPSKDLIVLTTTGTVQEVAFTWSWALSSSSSSKKKSDSDSDNNSWVRDAALTIKGLKFKMQLSVGNEETQNKIKRGLPPKSSSSKKLETIRKEGKLKAYVRDQVEQIIDALTLNVTEFNFTLALPQQEGNFSDITVGGQSVEARSLGRLFDATVGDKGSLKQQLSLRSFYANVRTLIKGQQKASTYPILAPFSYRVVATRRTGKRFSSFGSGLECIGEPLPSVRGNSDSLNDEGLVFHTSSVQMDALTRLGNIILASPLSSVNQEDMTSPKADVTPNDSSSLEETGDQLESLKQEILTSSVFKFPISGISIVLPNETKCTLDKFFVNYQADGTVMNIQGAEGSGIRVNDYPIVATNDGVSDTCLSKSRWSVDFISSTFSVAEVDRAITKDNQQDTDGVTDRIAFIQCRQDIIQNVMNGMEQIVKAANNLDYSTADSQNTVNDSPKKLPASKWTVDIQKRVEIRLESSEDDSEQETNQWINIFVDAPSIKLPLGPLSQIQCDGLVIGPSSHGNITISVPAMKQLQDDPLLRFNGPISTVVESSTVAQNLMNFLSGFSNSLLDTPEEMSQVIHDAPPNVSFAGLPISLDIPEMNFAILEPSMQVAVKFIKAEKTTFNASSFEFNDRNGTCVSLSELSVTRLPTLKVSAKQLDTLRLPGTFSLTKPLRKPAITLGENSSIDVKLTTIEGVLLNPVGDVENTTSTGKPGFNLNFPASLSIDKLTLQKEGTDNAQKAEEKDKLFLSVQKISFSVCPDTNKSPEVHVSTRVQSDADLSVNLHLGKFENQILQVHEMKATMSMNPNDLSKIRNLDLALDKPIKIHSGYSTVEWSQMFQMKKKNLKTTANSKPTLLPNANISPLQLQISADFKVIAQKDTTVGLSAFRGDSSTTSDDLIKYYSGKVKKQAPGMITHTEVLGTNVVDTSLATYGVFALKSGAYGGAAVGLISVVGVDGVFGALKAGRKSRGGADDESYEAGDFIRGLGYNITEATKAGGAKRKTKNSVSSSAVTADEDKGSLADFAVGATSGAIEYADKNKARLGGAGAAGVGMVVGTMLGGPIGGIAGGVFAGAATGKTIEGLEKKFTKCSSKSDEEKLEVMEDENQDSTIEQTNNRAIKVVGPPPTAISESVRHELELQIPQGLLYKQRDTFQNQWRPRLFVLHLDSQVLGYHFLSENVPPIVDTNKFNIFNKPALKEPDSSGNQIGFEAVPRGILHLPGCRIEVNEKLTLPAKNLFTFTVTPKDGGNNSRPWNLAATTEEARLMWVGMLAEMSGQIEDVKKLAEVFGFRD